MVREAVLNAMHHNTQPKSGPAAAAGGQRIEGNNVPHRKGSLLTTLSDLVKEKMENVGENCASTAKHPVKMPRSYGLPLGASVAS